MIQGNTILFIIIGFILSVFGALFRQKQNYNLVPRRIWTYWENPDNPSKGIPRVVKLCMESWKKFNPDYEIVLLTKKTVKGYVTIPDEIRTHPHYNDSPQRFADLVRLYVLEEHGGIWIDASILVKQPFDEWLFPKYGEFAGYHMSSFCIDKKVPIIENWFLAANKGSKFIKLWKQEFLKIVDFKDIQSYLDARKKMGVNFSKFRDPHYLAVYVAALKVIEVDKYPQDTLILRESEKGPFKYLHDTHWEPDKALALACIDKKYQTPLLKMRSNERNFLEKGLDYDLSLEKCGWLE